jgi:hypothetical protein
LFDLSLKILKERLFLNVVVVVLLDRTPARDADLEGDADDPTGFRGGDSRGGPCVGKKFCLCMGGDPIGSGELLVGQFSYGSKPTGCLCGIVARFG